jgi:hypothetical protein
MRRYSAAHQPWHNGLQGGKHAHQAWQVKPRMGVLVILQADARG